MLKPVNVIRCIPQNFKVGIKHYNIIRWY